tara:strand:- start:1 stop:438 length:438 start_codon:yes stop_codon:yes gene_type:complete
MAIQDSRRLNMVLPYLFPDLKNDAVDGDYHLENQSDGTGTQLFWHTDKSAEPTAQELADAKEAAMPSYWLGLLRLWRNLDLKETDWSQGADIPSALKTSYATYRQQLRDLPTTVVVPSFETLNNMEGTEFDKSVNDVFPTKPETD